MRLEASPILPNVVTIQLAESNRFAAYGVMKDVLTRKRFASLSSPAAGTN